FLKVMSCRMKNRDKALRLPTIRRLPIAVTASSNVRSECSAISANNQPACFSNGETLPPLGFAAELPSSLQRRSQLITELGLTSRSAATSCREAPPSTIAIARTRRSSEYGLAITLSFQKESRAPDSLIRRPLGIPRFEAGGICSNSRVFYTTREAAGALGARHSPRPPGRRNFASLGRFAPRDREAMSRRHCEERKRRSNPAFQFATPTMDCFACARNDGYD